MTENHTGKSSGLIEPACVDEQGRLTGFVHSTVANSAVDGPGMRFVLFVSGCHFRCLYCHNPDTIKKRNGRVMTADQVIEEIAEYASFLRFAGGLTISGGEPLLQADFVKEIFYLAKHDYNLHTALDTQGFLAGQLEDEWFEDVDLVLLDIKHIDPDKHLALTSKPVQPTLNFARRLSDMGKKVWIRYVLVPGYSDDYDDIEKLADFVASLNSVERVEVLPFHKMGENKWDELGYKYHLKDVQPPSPDLVKRVLTQFQARGLTAC